MRVSSDETVAEAWYQDDSEDGGCIVVCSECQEVFVDKTKCNIPCHCPKCKTELFYRPWWIW